MCLWMQQLLQKICLKRALLLIISSLLLYLLFIIIMFGKDLHYKHNFKKIDNEKFVFSLL